MKLEVLKTLCIIVVFPTLISCGGGGGGGEDWANQDPSAKAISTSSFDVQTAWTNLNNSPNTAQLNVSGSCTGTYIQSNSMALITGTNILNNVVTVNRAYGPYAPCSSPYENKSSVELKNTSYYYQKSNNQYKNYYGYDGTYIYYWRSIAAFPTSVKVGDSGLIGIIDKKNYSNVKVAVEEWSYTIEEDTAYSAVFNLVVKTYSTSSSVNSTDYLNASLGMTEQFRYLISQQNQLRLIKYDRVDADGFTIYGRLN